MQKAREFLSLRFLSLQLAKLNLQTKKTTLARDKEDEIREVARLGQKFVVMELS